LYSPLEPKPLCSTVQG